MILKLTANRKWLATKKSQISNIKSQINLSTNQPIFAFHLKHMQAPLPYRVRDNSFWLSAGRCIFWENKKTLILSDLHFGKTGHFRKSGIAVPQYVYKEDLHCLLQQVQFFQPEKLIVVGDLFHSDANKEHDLFKKWRKDMNGTEVHLVKGNHDFLNDNMYTDLDIHLHNEYLEHDPLVFVHDITNTPKFSTPTYSISGHIHPGIRISGLGKQALRFPCFYFTKNFAVLPAFSKFTGMALIHPQDDEAVFAIVENKLVQIQ